jgi:hypothetical protein
MCLISACPAELAWRVRPVPSLVSADPLWTLPQRSQDQRRDARGFVQDLLPEHGA